jgi:predicted deacetylase
MIDMKVIWRIVISVLAVIVGGLFLIRMISPRELDDVHPDIACSQDLIQRSDILWVIPDYKNDSIINQTQWCASLLLKNKTLGLHGVYHTYNEFDNLRNKEYVQKGIDDFQTCFGYRPEMFKAPQLALSGENKRMIESTGLIVKGRLNQILHKVYHCSDTGKFPNWVVRAF